MHKEPFAKKTKKLPVLPESNDDKLGANTHVQKMPQVESCYPLFVAKYEFVSSTYDELGFKKGELLYVISMDEGDWWFAKAKHSGREGHIPSNYVKEFDPLEAEE